MLGWCWAKLSLEWTESLGGLQCHRCLVSVYLKLKTSSYLRRSLILIWCRLSIATDDRLCFGDHVLDKGSGVVNFLQGKKLIFFSMPILDQTLCSGILHILCPLLFPVMFRCFIYYHLLFPVTAGQLLATFGSFREVTLKHSS